MNIEQFGDFQVAIGALKSKSVDIAIIEIRESESVEEHVSCYVIARSRHMIRNLPDFHRINDVSSFRTFRVFKSAEEVKKELS